MARKKPAQTNIPGFGCIFRMTYGSKTGTKRSAFWWMKYQTSSSAEPIRRSTHQRDQEAAFGELMKMAGARASGQIMDSAPEKVRIGQLLDMLIASYADKKTLYGLKSQVEKHLRPRFGDIRCIELRKRDLEEFVRSLKSKGKGPGTINRLLAQLRRALKLGTEEDPPLVLRIPKFPLQDERGNARQGRMTDKQYRLMRDDLAPHARLVLVIGYHLGMRRGEILGLRWDQVDFVDGLIRLESKQVKNREARTAPIYGDMRAYLDMAKSERDQKWPKCEYVVAFEGRRVSSIRTAWKASLRRLKLPHILVHDLRRTAATNMRKAGNSRHDVMRILGWKTEAMFRRYNIDDAEDAIKVGQTMDAYYAAQRTSSGEPKGKVM